MPPASLRVALAFLLLAPAAQAASRAVAPHLSVELLSDVEQLAPGAEFTLGIRYLIEEHWHVYWRNPGDSGLEPKVRWRLPQGFAAGEIQWPAPKLIRLKHLANYGYEEEALLLVKARAPLDLQLGTTATMSASLSWLVCQEACLPGQANLEIALPVGAELRLDAEQVEAFTGARSKLPLPSEEAGWSVRAGLERGGVHLELSSKTAALPKDAQFFPLVDGWVSATGVQRRTERDGALHLFVPLREDPDRDPPSNLTGVAVTDFGWRGEGSEPGLAIEIDWADDLPRFETLVGDSGAPGAWLAAGFAFLGGILLNLMPCVLPVLSLKILAFARIAGDGRRAAIVHAALFSAGVIATFWIVAAALLVLRAFGEQLGWGFQLQSPVMVAVLATLFTLLALNLFGVFEVGVPAVSGTAFRGRSDGFAAFGSGMLATLVATPCTAPFMGGAVGAALIGPWWLAAVVFTAIGAGMAFPYLLLAAFPLLLARIPKPGRWMESLRQALGFVLLATVAWLAWVFGHLSDGAGGTVGVNGLARLLAGLVLVGFGAWVHGRFGRLSLSPLRRGGVSALAALIVLLGLFLPLRAVTAEVERLDWKPWSPELVESLESEGRPYLLDFTAGWCLSCQVNEQVALDTPAVRAALARHGITAVKADWTNRDARITQALALLGRASVPVYVLDGGAGSEPRILPNILTETLVLEAIEDAMRQVQ